MWRESMACCGRKFGWILLGVGPYHWGERAWRCAARKRWLESAIRCCWAEIE